MPLIFDETVSRITRLLFYKREERKQYKWQRRSLSHLEWASLIEQRCAESLLICSVPMHIHPQHETRWFDSYFRLEIERWSFVNIKEKGVSPWTVTDDRWSTNRRLDVSFRMTDEHRRDDNSAEDMSRLHQTSSLATGRTYTRSSDQGWRQKHDQCHERNNWTACERLLIEMRLVDSLFESQDERWYVASLIRWGFTGVEKNRKWYLTIHYRRLTWALTSRSRLTLFFSHLLFIAQKTSANQILFLSFAYVRARDSYICRSLRASSSRSISQWDFFPFLHASFTYVYDTYIHTSSGWTLEREREKPANRISFLSCTYMINAYRHTRRICNTDRPRRLSKQMIGLDETTDQSSLSNNSVNRASDRLSILQRLEGVCCIRKSMYLQKPHLFWMLDGKESERFK